MTAPNRTGFVITGWHVLAGVVAFFACVIAVDFSFAYLAYRSAPGQVAGKPYETGLAYNREIAKREAARALGWTATAEASASPDGRVFEIQVADSSGRPVEGLDLSGEIVRPATEAGRRALAFHETAPGAYRAKAAVAGGAWDLHFAARGRRGAGFSGERRLVWR